MTEYNVVLVLTTVAGFTLSVGSVGVRFTKAIAEVKAATEALCAAVAELRAIITDLKNENRAEHKEFEKRLSKAENRLTALETAQKEE